MCINEWDSRIVKGVHPKKRNTAFIWDYEKKMEKQCKGLARQKDFDFCLFLRFCFMMVNNWMVATKLHGRVLLSDILGKYILDYRCILIQ